MVITASPPLAQSRATSPAPQQPPANPEPTPPSDAFDGHSAGRLAAGLVGGAAAGAGLGYLGMQGGGMLGLLIGMETTPAAAGLGEFFVHSLQGAAWGSLAGAALYGGVGLAVGALGATWLYDKVTA